MIQIMYPNPCILWGARTDTSVDISVDTLVDTWSSMGRYINWVLTDASTDTPIGRYAWWFTETYQQFTDTSLILYLHQVCWFISVDISVDTLVDTRPALTQLIMLLLVSVDVSADTLVDTPVDLVSVDISVDSI